MPLTFQIKVKSISFRSDFAQGAQHPSRTINISIDARIFENILRGRMLRPQTKCNLSKK